MPLYRYYLSDSPGDPSPATDELLSIDADSPADAVTRLRRENRLPTGPSNWIHFLVWSDPTGRQRGFESLPLSKFE